VSQFQSKRIHPVSPVSKRYTLLIDFRFFMRQYTQRNKTDGWISSNV